MEMSRSRDQNIQDECAKLSSTSTKPCLLSGCWLNFGDKRIWVVALSGELVQVRKPSPKRETAVAKELWVTFSKLGTVSKLAKYNGQGDEVGVSSNQSINQSIDGVVKWKEDGIVNTHVNALAAVRRVPEHVHCHRGRGRS